MSTPQVGAVRLDDIRFHDHNVRRDLGDLRPLTDSIRRYGVMQPVVVEHRGDHLRLRAGHRRVAAARLAGLARIPAIIHGKALANDEWLVHAVQENVMRQGLSTEERADTVEAMRREGLTWAGIAEAFGVTTATVRRWCRDTTDPPPVDEETASLTDKVRHLTNEGRSAAQIADQLGITARTVVRHRTGVHKGHTTTGKSRHLPVKSPVLQKFISTWRDQPDATVADVLDALEQLRTTGGFSTPANDTTTSREPAA